MPLRMCRGREKYKPAESEPVLRWWLRHEIMRENILFKDQLFWFLEHTQDFEVALSGATRVKGLKLPNPTSLRKFTLKKRAFKSILNLTRSKWGLKGLSN